MEYDINLSERLGSMCVLVSVTVKTGLHVLVDCEWCCGGQQSHAPEIQVTYKKALRVCLHSTQRNWTVLLDRAPTESLPVGQIKQCQHLVLIVVEVVHSAEISLLSFYSCFFRKSCSTYSSPHAPVTKAMWLFSKTLQTYYGRCGVVMQ